MKEYLRNVLFVGTMVFCCGCEASNSEALSAIANEGLTNPVLGDASVFSGCSREQGFNRSFSAQRGDRAVHGVVCCNTFACSVRYTD